MRSSIDRRLQKCVDDGCASFTNDVTMRRRLKLNAHKPHVLCQEKRLVGDELCSATSCRNFRYMAATG